MHIIKEDELHVTYSKLQRYLFASDECPLTAEGLPDTEKCGELSATSDDGSTDFWQISDVYELIDPGVPIDGDGNDMSLIAILEPGELFAGI